MKRLIDILGALTAIIIFAPLMIILILLLSADLKGSPFFTQWRPGKGGKPFRLIKLRTMTNSLGEDGTLLPDCERITPIGRLLRSTSSDELPGLWNVLKGEMSLVGPRPLLMEYLPLYTPEQARRHEVRPGITGWAQISGRNALSWEEKFALDIWYVDNLSFWLDLKILWFTIRKVIIRDGISANGEATMPKFRGSSAESDK